MCVALIGGMDRLEKHYTEEATKHNIKLKVFTKIGKNTMKKIGEVDAVVIFTNKVSHGLTNTIKRYCYSKNIPFLMVHSCGISTLKNCIENIKNKKNEKRRVL